MCGRFVLYSLGIDLEEQFEARFAAARPAPRYNILPGTHILIVRADASGRRAFGSALWGLIPSWAKDRKLGFRTINARAETLAEKPAFRAAFRRRRCLIPADGFYEWQATASGKQPYYFRGTDRRPLAFAGLWETWRDPATGESVLSATIVVTSANALVRPIHDRMPAILRPEHYGLWLDAGTTDPSALSPLLAPAAPEWLTLHPVSRRVSTPANDDASLIEPLVAP